MKLSKIIMNDGNIHLRLIEEKDKEEYYQVGFAEADEEVNYYTGTDASFSLEDIEKYVSRIVSDETRYDFLICDEMDRILGEVVLNEIDEESRMANLRIGLFRKQFLEKGVGTLSLQMAISFAFRTLKLHRVELEVFEYNHRAKHCYEKIGFIEEGRKRDALFYKGQYYHVIIMAMLESDYL